MWYYIKFISSIKLIRTKTFKIIKIFKSIFVFSNYVEKNNLIIYQ